MSWGSWWTWNGWSCRFMSFFFSSRRRHTRFDCDWSSDVCSSDLRRLRRLVRRLRGADVRDAVAGLLGRSGGHLRPLQSRDVREGRAPDVEAFHRRSEEHTSELQAQSNLVCRLPLEKKKNTQ